MSWNRPWLQRLVTALAAIAGVLLLTATQASAAGPGFYRLSATTAHFQVLSTSNLTSGEVDDQLFPLSTSGSGLTRLPFPLHAFNQTYQNAVVSSNGNVQLGLTVSQATAAPANDCLPSEQFGHPAVMPFWDDLLFGADVVQTFPQGIFVHTAGAAPHRTFLVSWQGQVHGSGSPVLAQVVFTEGSQTIVFRYGSSSGGSATIGLQSKQQLSSAEWACNSGRVDVTNGMRVTAVHTNTEPPA